MDPDQRNAWCAMWLQILKRVSSVSEAVDVLKCTPIGLTGDPKDLWLWLLAQSHDVVDALQSAVLSAAVTAASALTDDREIQLVVYRAVHGFGTLNVHLVPAVFELCMLKASPPSATRCMTMAVNVLRKAKNVWVRHDSDLAATGTEHDSDRQILYDNMVALVLTVLRRVMAAAVQTARRAGSSLRRGIAAVVAVSSAGIVLSRAAPFRGVVAGSDADSAASSKNGEAAETGLSRPWP